MKYIRILLSWIVFLLFFTASLLAILLTSAGLLALPMSVVYGAGIGSNVARVVSDLSPVSMFFAGISCLSAGLALTLAIVVYFPKQIEWFRDKNYVS
jgi:hypothetical protein